MASNGVTDAERLMKISTEARTQLTQERTEKYAKACKLAFDAITKDDAQKFETAANNGHPGTYIYKWTLTSYEDTTYQFDGMFLTSLMKKSGLYYMLKEHYEASGYHFGWRSLNSSTPYEFGIYVAWNKELFIKTFQKPYRKVNKPNVTQQSPTDGPAAAPNDDANETPSHPPHHFDGRGRGRGGQFNVVRGKGKGRGFYQTTGKGKGRGGYEAEHGFISRGRGRGRGGKGNSRGLGYQRKSPGLFDIQIKPTVENNSTIQHENKHDTENEVEEAEDDVEEVEEEVEEEDEDE
jgi:hypothetical protein